MVLLPVPIEGTMSKLVETLPSATSLTLLVDTRAAGFRLVCLPKVVKALKWLKENNRLYANIKINEQFRFDPETDDITFEKDDDADELETNMNFLITNDENDPYLLEPDEFDLQLVYDLDMKVPEGKALDHYSLRKNPYDPFK